MTTASHSRVLHGWVVDQDAVHEPVGLVTSIVPCAPISDAGYSKKLGSHSPVLDAGWRIHLLQKMAGGSLLGLGKDRIVRLARRSFVKSWRPRFPSVAPPSSPKIDVGTSTLSPVGIVYLCHSKFAAAAGNVDTRTSKKSELTFGASAWAQSVGR